MKVGCKLEGCQCSHLDPLARFKSRKLHLLDLVIAL